MNVHTMESKKELYFDAYKKRKNKCLMNKHNERIMRLKIRKGGNTWQKRKKPAITENYRRCNHRSHNRNTLNNIRETNKLRRGRIPLVLKSILYKKSHMSRKMGILGYAGIGIITFVLVKGIIEFYWYKKERKQNGK